MDFTCEKHLLTEGLNLVGRTVPARTTMPILECVLLMADVNGLCLVANDMEMSIQTAPLAARVDEVGSVALNARLFTEIVRKMPGDTVRVTTDAHNAAECVSGRAKFKINGMPGDEFPMMPEAEKDAGMVRVKATVLKDMIRQTIFSVAVDESKPILTGELLRCDDNKLVMVAVDGFRISYRCALLESGNTDMLAVIPSKTLNELSRVLPGEGEEEVGFFITDKRVVFEFNAFTFISRILEGDFIRYDQVFNEDFATMITLSRADFLNGLERACLIARDNRKSPVKLEVKPDAVIITSNTEMGQSYDEIACVTDGKELEIAFNPRYFIEALRAVEEERIALKFMTALSPCIMRGAETDDFKYLILPLRLRA